MRLANKKMCDKGKDISTKLFFFTGNAGRDSKSTRRVGDGVGGKEGKGKEDGRQTAGSSNMVVLGTAPTTLGMIIMPQFRGKRVQVRLPPGADVGNMHVD